MAVVDIAWRDWFAKWREANGEEPRVAENNTIIRCMQMAWGAGRAAERAALSAPSEQVACDSCDGTGEVVEYTDPYQRGDVSSPERKACPDCAPEQVAASVAVPEGWRLVPKFPTEKMVDAAHDADDPGDDPCATPQYGAAYIAMLAAAPECAK